MFNHMNVSLIQEVAKSVLDETLDVQPLLKVLAQKKREQKEQNNVFVKPQKYKRKFTKPKGKSSSSLIFGINESIKRSRSKEERKIKFKGKLPNPYENKKSSDSPKSISSKQSHLVIKEENSEDGNDIR